MDLHCIVLFAYSLNVQSTQINVEEIVETNHLLVVREADACPVVGVGGDDGELHLVLA